MAQVAQIAVYNTEGLPTGEVVPLHPVFNAPIRPDLIAEVHRMMMLNKRQPYGTMVHNGPHGKVAGMQHSAHSWGTGRAVSRIPRVSGGGTHRAGQGAFGNMCRSGRIAFPLRPWRRWHRKINLNKKRYAVASALAASCSAPLVMARGHRIAECPEIPLIVDFDEVKKTKLAVKLLKSLGLQEEMERCEKLQTRAGKGKYHRGRKRRKGALIIYTGERDAILGFRNILGVQVCHVSRLNLLLLAPGAHLGRLIIWQKKAMEQIPRIYEQKKESGWELPSNLITNGDITGNMRKRSMTASIAAVFDQVVLSEEVQKSLKEPRLPRHHKRRKLNLMKAKHYKPLITPDQEDQEKEEE